MINKSDFLTCVWIENTCNCLNYELKYCDWHLSKIECNVALDCDKYLLQLHSINWESFKLVQYDDQDLFMFDLYYPFHFMNFLAEIMRNLSVIKFLFIDFFEAVSRTEGWLVGLFSYTFFWDWSYPLLLNQGVKEEDS